MAQYTIEDVEILRQKSGVSYEEAVNLLEYHNGSLARALVDLEKNGRIKQSKAAVNPEHHRGGRRLLDTLYRIRLKIAKGQVTVINLSSLFVIFSVLVAPWLVVIGFILALLLGYRISVDRGSHDFSGESVESMLRNAGNNVRNTVSSIARDFSQPQSAPQAAQPEPERPRSETPASGTTPVSVQFSEDGSVHVSDDDNGFHEADIQ